MHNDFVNQNPEQKARDIIDRLLSQSGWIVQSKKRIDLHAGLGVAVREYQTEIGPADYLLFVEGTPVGIIEAKKEDEGVHLVTMVEEQSAGYAKAKLKYLNNSPLPFVYESTGTITRFTDFRDPKPRSREVFSFHRPETFIAQLKREKSLRARIHDIPLLDYDGLRDCQTKAISNLEISFKENRPRSLIQMATGAGKTFTAITFIYRLLKFAGAKRILFLVDTKNLGKQAEQEFSAYTPVDDGRKFTEMYNVQRLTSSYISPDAQVVISTIQRLYSILRGEELDESSEEENPNETNSWEKREPLPVVYSEKIPPEFFEFIVIDECHRSIYNLWKQVLDYSDSFLIGLTATPDKRTFGFFNENVVSEYTYQDSVADGVNVGFDVFLIETDITKNGAVIAEPYIEKREKLTRKKRWEELDEVIVYDGKNKLDRDVVNLSQIRNVVRCFRDNLKNIFPNRKETPKTLIFAKTDSHADDIIQIVREEFGESNEFCKKITSKSTEDTDTLLASFRNDYNPRIAVTVDMIATGTDVKSLECLLFMRDVKSRSYYEQMKGRGTRSIKKDDLLKVSSSAVEGKDHFVIVDAVGVTKSVKTDSRPLERKPTVSLRELLNAVAVGAVDEDLYSSLANRLIRMEKQLTDKEKEQFVEKSGGKTISQTAKELLNAYDPDLIETKARELQPNKTLDPSDEYLTLAQKELAKEARKPFTGAFAEFVDNLRKIHDQVFDTTNIDHITFAGWDAGRDEDMNAKVESFREYIEANRDEITALSIFYNQSRPLSELTYKMVQEVVDHLKANKPNMMPLYIWEIFARLNRVSGKPSSELTALVSLVRLFSGRDTELTLFDAKVKQNFQEWVFGKHAGTRAKFSEEQMSWLQMIRDHIATSLHCDAEDLEYAPFDANGGMAKMYDLFRDEMGNILKEMNLVLVA